MLSLGLFASSNCFEFNEVLREVVEADQIVESAASLAILDCVYMWLGSKLPEFFSKGMSVAEMEELRGIGLK